MAEETWGGREKYLYSRFQVSYQNIMANVDLKPSYATPPPVEPSKLSLPAYTVTIEQGPSMNLGDGGLVYASIVARGSAAAIGLAKEILQGLQGWLPEVLIGTLKISIAPNPAFTSYLREAKELQRELETKADSALRSIPLEQFQNPVQRPREIDLGESVEEY